MNLRINIEQGEILELTNIYTKEIIRYKCQKCKPRTCENCAFIGKDDICGVVNCIGNSRKDKTFVNFVKVE